MRFTIYNEKLNFRTTRIVSKFVIYKKLIREDGQLEIRVLENCKIKQELIHKYRVDGLKEGSRWIDKEWAGI